MSRPITLLPVFVLLLSASCAHTAMVSAQIPVTGWMGEDDKNTVIMDYNTSSPVWGSGAANSADNTSIYAPFAGINLARDGDSLTVTGSMELFGSLGGYDQLRIGLFNSGGSTTNRAWTGGYFFSNSHGERAGFLRMRKNNEPTRNFMTAAGGTGKGGFLYAEGRPEFTQSSYSFLLGLTRINDTSINITMSLVSLDGSYRFLHDYLDNNASPESFYLDRMGFLSGDQLDTDLIQLRNITLTHGYTPVPEPSSTLLALAGMAGGLTLRRTRPSAGTRPHSHSFAQDESS